mmetsp:Transcript_160041/g.282176  ORF Transcript_160041/g.282176 Transcript_160041/m.282176 type:complete len:443 (+) Transcript_160041:78-1406(+)
MPSVAITVVLGLLHLLRGTHGGWRPPLEEARNTQFSRGMHNQLKALAMLALASEPAAFSPSRPGAAPRRSSPILTPQRPSVFQVREGVNNLVHHTRMSAAGEGNAGKSDDAGAPAQEKPKRGVKRFMKRVFRPKKFAAEEAAAKQRAADVEAAKVAAEAEVRARSSAEKAAAVAADAKAAAEAEVAAAAKAAEEAKVAAEATAAKEAEAAREEAKKELLSFVTGTEGGKKATEDELLAVASLMRPLERNNPTSDPAASPLVSGKWALLYTGASKRTDEARKAKEGLVGSAVSEFTRSRDPDIPRWEEPSGNSSGTPTGRLLTTATNQVIDNRGNFQDIDAENGRVVNRAEIALFGVKFSIAIEGRCELVPSEKTGGQAKRLNVNFERVSVQNEQGEALLQVPLTWVNNGEGPFGYVDTTYLDEDLRLGRGDKGSIFVTARMK